MKKYIYVISSVLFGMSLSGCNDALDLTPKDKVTEADYFTTVEDLKLFTNPYYNNIPTKVYYDEQNDHLVQKTLSNELRGGTFRTVPDEGGGWSWTDLRRINSLLARVDRCPDKAAVVEYTALSRMFRAYFYFEKVKRFGDVPWYDTEIGSSDIDLLYRPRDSREYVMQKMLEDIDYAIENMPDHKAQENVPFRATKWTALALKSRFCLFEGTFRKYHGISLGGHDWQYYLEQAADASYKLINEGPYKIYTTGDPKMDYRNMFRAEVANSDEYILAISYDIATSQFHDAYGFSFAPARGMPGYTRKFVNTYLMTDGTAFTDHPGWQEMTFVDEMKNRDPRLSQSIRSAGYTHNGKLYLPNPSESTTGYNPIKFVPDGVSRNDYCTNDVPIFRIAETMLNYAEAKAELGTLTQSDLDMTVNKIRDRVGMPHLNMVTANASPDRYLSSAETGYPNVEGSNKGVILEIRRERGVELVQEGFRWADIRRWKAGYCFDQEITGMYFPGAGEYDLDGDGKTDIVLYANGTSKPTVSDDVQVYEIGTDDGVKLTDGNRGYINYHEGMPKYDFNEGRDYLYPIPLYDINLAKSFNPSDPPLTQNPGW